MTNYTWTDNMMRSGSTCDVDKVADNLMHLKYDTSGGVCKFDSKGTISANFTLSADKITTGDVSGNYTLTLPSVTDAEKQVVCIFDFTTTNASYPSITNTNILKKDGKIPSFSTLSSVRNVLTFKSAWVGSELKWEVEYSLYGGVLTNFTQPALSSNGILGSSNFAISTTFATFQAFYLYQAFDNNTSTFFSGDTGSTGNIIIYNPTPLIVSNINITNPANVYSYGVIGNCNIYGSNDNFNYTYLTNYDNNNIANNTSWDIAIPSNVRDFYKYYKIAVSDCAGLAAPAAKEILLTAQYIATS